MVTVVTLVLILEGKVLIFHHYEVSCRFVMYGLYYVEEVPSILNFSVFTMKKILSAAPSASNEVII